MDPAIKGQGLNRYFGQGEARKQAIWDLNLTIKRGTLTILMGPSGLGETTVLTLMGCLRDVQEGEVSLLGHELHGTSEGALVARHMLGLVGLAERVDCLPGNLSGGQKQRVAAARVVVEMLKALGQARGVTTVMVTHDNRIMDLADRIITLEESRVVADTNP